MTPAFAAIYTTEQRDAIGHAYVDKRIRPASRVAELAAAGELRFNGQRLAPFAISEGSVRDIGRKLRKRRAGELTSELAAQPPRDAVEAMRRRLVSLADRELAHLEKRKPGMVKGEELRQLVRTLRELAALPGPDEPRPRKPGADGQEGRTTGGLAGAILHADTRVSTRGETASETPTPPTTHTAEQDGTHTTDGEQSSGDTEAPGAWVREQLRA